MKNFLKRGFTLIELLIVIAIIGILTAIVTTNLVAARGRARDTKRKGDLQAISQSLRLYYSDYQSFPLSTVNNPKGRIKGCGTNGTTTCAWDTAFSKGGSTTYMGHLPLDPSSTSTKTVTYHYYSSATDRNNFALVAKLENISDSDIHDSQTRCSSIYSSFTGPKDDTVDYVVCAE